MEEQTSWKGHAFTLMIFCGIVVLCSIFFVLGMLVGRTQSVKIATVAAAEAASKTVSRERENYAEKRSAVVGPKVQPSVQPLAPAPPPPPPAPANTISLQVAALKRQTDAEKQVDELKQKGFRAFIVTPAPDDPNPFYRVQVGAADAVEAESLKQQLEAAGFKPIIKK